MTTPRQLTQTAFGGGIDERQRAELFDPTVSFRTLENIRHTERGTASKRFGFTAQTLARADGGNRSAGYKMFAAGDVTCVSDGTSLDIYSPGVAKNWRLGRLPSLGVTRVPVSGVGDAPTSFCADSAFATGGSEYLDCAYANGFYFVATLEQIALSGAAAVRIVIHVVERATKTTVKTFVHGTNVTPGCILQCVAVGNTIVFAYSIGAAPTAATITTFTMDATSATTIYAGLTAVGNIVTDTGGVLGDWAICGLTTKYVIAYANSSGGANSLTVKTFTPSATVASSTSTAVNTTSAVQCVAVDGSEADIIYVAWALPGANNLHVVGFNPSLAITSTDATIFSSVGIPKRLGVKRTSATTGVVTARYAGHVAANTAWPVTAWVAFATSAGATGVTGAVGYNQCWSPWTQPFLINSRVYQVHSLTTGDAVEIATNMGVFDVTPPTSTRAGAQPMAMPAVGLSPGPVGPVYSSNLHHVVTVSSRVAAYAQWVRVTGSGTKIEIVEIDAGDARRWQQAEHNGTTYLSAGMVYGFDGRQLFESGYTQPPAIALTSGGTGITGTFNYTAIYEWTDAQGSVHWSEPSAIKTITVANKTVTITSLTFTATWKDGVESDATIAQPSNARRVRIKVFRTITNGTVYYYLGTILNDPTRDSSTLTDAVSDANLQTGAQLYTQPGQVGTALGRQAAPAAGSIATYQDMLVALADDGQTVWTTAQRVVGEGAWWSPIFQYPIAQGTVAVRAQDGTLFAWTRRAIYTITGTSPSDNGGSGGLGLPSKLAVDVGCIDARSLCLTSKGIFFQSERGIELLTRSQDVIWVGEKIQKTLASFPICTSAVLDPLANVVYFELAASESAGQVSGSGRTLVLDLTLTGPDDPVGTWVSTDRRKNQAGVADTPSQSAAIIYTGSAYRYAWLGTDGRVYAEDRTTYLDPGSAWVTQRAEWGWFKNAGAQGYQEVELARFLLKQITGHDLSLYVAYDYSSSYKAARTWSAAELATLIAALPNEQVEHPLHDDNECQAITFKIEDATPTSGSVGTGQGATWLALALSGMAREGLYPLPGNLCR